ncbi:uncharacterized protein LOC106711185 [Papilio machaon]|uniref:uncharacterized protein LOC106711185 n=1 Tax=Papilio machaon TaxID=76193 RepID=UPI0006EB1CB6|nr:uncharacterized protein LOC106711185 [Papilio machaon]
MSDARSKDLIKLRGSIKGKLTIFHNFLNTLESIVNVNETQFNELDSRLNKIDCLHNDFDKFQTELEMLSDDPNQLMSEREEFESKYFALVSTARTILNKYQRDRQRAMSVSESSDGGVDREVTALVNVVAGDGNLHPARLLLDNASTAHFVTRHLCDKLGLPRRHVSSSVTVCSQA